MPCNSGYDGGASLGDISRLERENRKLAAILCGVIRAVAPEPFQQSLVFASVDWKEAGVSHDDAIKWWMEHFAKDAERMANEQNTKG